MLEILLEPPLNVSQLDGWNLIFQRTMFDLVGGCLPYHMFEGMGTLWDGANHMCDKAPKAQNYLEVESCNDC